MRRRRTRIRTRLLATFSIILLLSFSLIGGVFNVAARQYIQNSAISQLDATYTNMTQFFRQADDIPPMLIDGEIGFLPPEYWRGAPPVRPNAFRISSNVFVIDGRYNLAANQDVTDEALEILQAVRDANVRVTDLRNMVIRTDDGVYYVSAYTTPDNPVAEISYFIIYADVTGLIYFANTINIFTIVLVCVMFLVTVFVTFFLSNTITRPIGKLSVFASQIGHGDFTPSGFVFKDEEFENLNNALNNSARHLSIYDSEQKAFFQNASHELRTPLMSIQCYAEGISFGFMEPKKASETILEETRRLSELVVDLLYISKIDNITSVYKAEKKDLLEIIRSCAERQRMVADKKGILLTFDFSDSLVEYECVGELISRSIDNLLSNAIRYAASEIILSCHSNPRQMTISVNDDGSGIEAESLPHVFERFYKGNGGNHGIGLSIVKSIAEQHHGSVTAENRDDGGAKFTITLPITKRR